MGYQDIQTVMSLKELLEKTKMFRSLLKGRALSKFEHCLRKSLGAEDAEL
jgi:hypothetical protein